VVPVPEEGFGGGECGEEEVGGGGGGACLDGWKEVYLAASAACRLDSARSALYSWIDSRDGRWYSTVYFELRRGFTALDISFKLSY
jgi:hypothetical protein